MSLVFADNLSIQMKKQNVERDSFKTLVDMKNYPETSLPPIFIATNEETGKLYLYNENNSVDATLGKWREHKDGNEVKGVVISKDQDNVLTEKTDGLFVEKLKISQDSDNIITEKTDGLYVKDIEISQDQDNTITKKIDGLFVPNQTAKISKEANNVLEQKTDGLYSPKQEVDVSTKTDNVLVKETDGLFVPKPKDVEISKDQNNALENKTDGLFVNKVKGVEISKDINNTLEEKTDGLFVRNQEAKISTKQDNALTKETDGLYVGKVKSVEISKDTNNILEEKTDGLFVPNQETEISKDTNNAITKKNDGIYVEGFNNKNVLDKLSTDSDDNLLYDGKKIKPELDIASDTQLGVIKTDGITTITDKDGTLKAYGEPAYVSVSKEGRIVTVSAEDVRGATTVFITDGKDGIDGINPTISIDPTNNHWIINSVDSGVSAKGDKGEAGTGFKITKHYNSIAEMIADTNNVEDSAMVLVVDSVLNQGALYIRIKDYKDPKGITDGWLGIGTIDPSEIKGEKGDKGDNGITPTIDPNTNHWMIGDYDTNVVAKGETPYIDFNTNHWIVEGQDTGVLAEGKTPYIDSTSHNWFIDGQDTGVYAKGEKGDKGFSPSANVVKVGDTATITITDENGTTTTTIKDAENAYDDTKIKKDISDIQNELSSFAKSTDIPTKVSQLQNDSKYITDIDLPSIATDKQVGLVKVDNSTIKVGTDGTISATVSSSISQKSNNQITQETDGLYVAPTDLSQYAKTTSIPTKVSELQNDSKFATETQLPTIATDTKVGTVKVDNDTIKVSTDGTISSSIATDTQLGVVKVDGTTMSVDSDGTLHSIGSSTSAISKKDKNILTQESDGLYVPETDLSSYAKTTDLPTKTSDITNDGVDGTSTYVEKKELSKVATSNKYSDLDNTPTKLSEFNNDIIATTLKAGTVIPDNDTIKVDGNGKITATIGANSISRDAHNQIELRADGIYVDAVNFDDKNVSENTTYSSKRIEERFSETSIWNVLEDNVSYSSPRTSRYSYVYNCVTDDIPFYGLKDFTLVIGNSSATASSTVNFFISGSEDGTTYNTIYTKNFVRVPYSSYQVFNNETVVFGKNKMYKSIIFGYTSDDTQSLSLNGKIVYKTNFDFDSSVAKLDDVGNVELNNIQDKQSLLWDNANSKWVNGDAFVDKIENIDNVEITNIQDKQSLMWDNTSQKWINGNIDIDDELSITSENPLQNKVITERLNKIDYSQDVINSDLDYCYAKMSANQTLSSANTFLNFDTIIESNGITYENNGFKLKANKTYKLFANICQTNTTAGGLYNFVNSKGERCSSTQCFNQTANAPQAVTPMSVLECIYTPKEDTIVRVQLSDKDAGTFIYRNTENCIIIEEVGRAITKDTLKHANATSGIEDSPVGHIMSYMGTTPPKHYLACDGSVYNIVDYPYLSKFIKDEFGSYDKFGGDGINTFAVPNLQGEFLRGSGENSHENQGSGGKVGEHQDGTEHRSYNTYFNTFAIQYAQKENTDIPESPYNLDSYRGRIGYRSVNGSGFTVNTNNDVVALYTSRPTNTSVLYCIKYEPTYYHLNLIKADTELHKYSEGEKVVGQWIDGKPLYEKTYVINQTTVGSVKTNINDLNTDYVEITNGCFILNTNAVVMVNDFLNANYYTFTSIDVDKTITTQINGWIPKKVYITIQYTKTTDTPLDDTDIKSTADEDAQDIYEDMFN